MRRRSGKALDASIIKELELMLVEGIETSPISPKAVHARLIKNGYIKGGLSTLSKSHRKELIKEYKEKQMELAGLSPKLKKQN